MICDSCKSDLDLKLIESRLCPVCSVDIFDKLKSIYDAKVAFITGFLRPEIRGSQNKINLVIESLDTNFDENIKRQDKVAELKRCALKLVNIFETNYKSKYSDDYVKSRSGQLSRAIKSFVISNFQPNQESIDKVKDFITCTMSLDMLRMEKYVK